MRRQNDARECLRKRLLEPGHTPATPRNQPHIARGSAAAGRCLREREGRFASFLTPAPSGTDLPPLATQHAGKIGSRFQSVERRSPQHFIASMSVRLHRIRCSACSGFGVHDGWNTHFAYPHTDFIFTMQLTSPDPLANPFQLLNDRPHVSLPPLEPFVGELRVAVGEARGVGSHRCLV